eukprot:scaffold106833_cov33-Phaeocystis_antarctica.AAC.1
MARCRWCGASAEPLCDGCALVGETVQRAAGELTRSVMVSAVIGHAYSFRQDPMASEAPDGAGATRRDLLDLRTRMLLYARRDFPVQLSVPPTSPRTLTIRLESSCLAPITAI